MNHPAPVFFDDVPLPEIGETASGKKWALREANLRDVSTMVQKLELAPQLARALSSRGVKPEGALAYLNPSLRESLPDPFVLKDMETAAKAIASAVEKKTGIGVFGDYDVDGTSAAAILKRYFAAIGFDLPVYLPDRMAEGYGPSIEAFRSLKNDGAETIITVDCGASAHDVIEQAAGEGVKVIVLDHHLMSGDPPKGAVAVVNPNREDDISGLTNLSAAGVAFLAVIAVNRQLRKGGFFKNRTEPSVMELLGLAALGLVCDVMEMTGLTRVLVAQGLKVMKAGANPGLRALASRAGAKGDPSSYHLGFLIGPRINAAGRIGHARLAFELMATEDPARAAELAEKLHVMNAERQAIEADVQLEALRQIENKHLDDHEIIIAAGEGWHAGVIGIVAGRIKEKFDKPAIVIGVDNGIGKGSGRSIPGVDLGRAISSARESGLLIAGGGHSMAAGLTVAEAEIETLRRKLNDELAEAVREARINRTQKIDAVVDSSAVTRGFAETIELAGPFGPGNPEPVFAVCDLRVAGVRLVGENHLSLTLQNASGASVRAIAFRAEGERLGEILRTSARVHIAGKIRSDDWRGGDAGQLQVMDAAPAG